MSLNSNLSDVPIKLATFTSCGDTHTFNVKNVYPNFYNKLSAENFIPQVVSAGETTYAGIYSYHSYFTAPSVSYNSETGIVALKNGTHTSSWGIGQQYGSVRANVTTDLYLCH